MRKIVQLDSIRGLAALGVLFYHFFTPYFFWAWSCVELFFVLSGFLISTIIIENSDKKGFLKAFYFRRFLRIWPVYFFTLFFSIVIYYLIFDKWFHNDGGLTLTFIFLQYTDLIFNLKTTFTYLDFFQQSWSVAVEEQFYLIFPLILIFLKPNPLVVFLCALFACFFSIYYRGMGFESGVLLGSLHGLFFGVLLAFLHAKKYKNYIVVKFFHKYLSMILGIIFLIGLCLVFRYILDGYGVDFKLNANKLMVPYNSLGFVLIYFTIISVVIFFPKNYLNLLLENKYLRGFGDISYGLYMYHPLFFFIANQFFVFQSNLLNKIVLLFTMLFSIGFSYLSFKYIELPILRFKDKFQY